MSRVSRRSLLSQHSLHFLRSRRSQRSRLGQRILLLRLTDDEGICTILYSLANISWETAIYRQKTLVSCETAPVWFERTFD
jgi:hypothetical protein